MSLNRLDPNRFRAASGVRHGIGVAVPASSLDGGELFDAARWRPLRVAGATRNLQGRSWAASSLEDEPSVSEVIVVHEPERSGLSPLLGFANSLWDDLWKWWVSEAPHAPPLGDVFPTDGPTTPSDWGAPRAPEDACAGMKTYSECEMRSIFIRFLQSMHVGPLAREALRLEQLGDPRALGVRSEIRRLSAGLETMQADWENCCTGANAPPMPPGCDDMNEWCA